MQTKLRSDAFLCEAMEACGDAVYRLALCRMGSRAGRGCAGGYRPGRPVACGRAAAG